MQVNHRSMADGVYLNIASGAINAHNEAVEKTTSSSQFGNIGRINLQLILLT